MSFSSSQYQSPIYTNLTTIGTTDLNNVTTTGTTNMLGQLNMAAGENINANNSSIYVTNANITGTLTLGSGADINATESSINVVNANISGSLNMSSGANINANNSSISGAFINCGLDTTIDRTLIFNEDGSSSIHNSFALQGGTTLNASN